MSFFFVQPVFLLTLPVLLFPLLFRTRQKTVPTQILFGAIQLLFKTKQKFHPYNFTDIVLFLRISILTTLIFALSQPVFVYAPQKQLPISVDLVLPDTHQTSFPYPKWALESNNTSNLSPQLIVRDFPIAKLTQHITTSSDVLVIADIPMLTVEQADFLRVLAKTGKGLIISLGPETDIESWNFLFFNPLFDSAELKPLTLTENFSSAKNTQNLNKHTNEFLHPLLLLFQSQSENISFPVEYTFSLSPNSDFTPILFTQTGIPFFYIAQERPHQHSHILLLTSSTLSGPLPLSPHFVSLFSESVFWTSEKTSKSPLYLTPWLLYIALFLFIMERYWQRI